MTVGNDELSGGHGTTIAAWLAASAVGITAQNAELGHDDALVVGATEGAFAECGIVFGQAGACVLASERHSNGRPSGKTWLLSASAAMSLSGIVVTSG